MGATEKILHGLLHIAREMQLTNKQTFVEEVT
jgi:hypothetical protein